MVALDGPETNGKRRRGQRPTRVGGTSRLWLSRHERWPPEPRFSASGLTLVIFGRATMIRLFGAAAILAMAATVAAPALAHSRHHRHVHHEPLISYLHNYGPGPVAGTY